jgi:hypothetical protein
MLEKRGDILYVGVDESNHGRFPEIFVAVASLNYQDSLIFPDSKKVRKEQQLVSSLRIRDYRYSVISEEHYKRYSAKNIMPLVSSKLIESFSLECEFLNCYIDGEFRSDQKKLLEGLIKNQESLIFQSVSIKDVPKGDKRQTNYIISLADGWASWIAKNIKTRRITSGMVKRKVEFI